MTIASCFGFIVAIFSWYIINKILKRKRLAFTSGRNSVQIIDYLRNAGFPDDKIKEAELLFIEIGESFEIAPSLLRLSDTLESLSMSDSIMGVSEGLTDIEELLRKYKLKDIMISSTVFDIIKEIIDSKD